MKTLMKLDEDIKKQFANTFIDINKWTLEDITDADYKHLKRVLKESGIKNLVHYHGSYFQSDTLLLAGVFENFVNKCLEIYELDPAHFLSVPELARQPASKKTKVEI